MTRYSSSQSFYHILPHIYTKDKSVDVFSEMEKGQTLPFNFLVIYIYPGSSSYVDMVRIGAMLGTSSVLLHFLIVICVNLVSG